MTAIASAHLLVEIGEVLSWLSAACRSSTQERKMMYCSPDIHADGGSYIVHIKQTFLEIPDADTICAAEDGKSDCCWHKIFNNATVTNGYPIPPRTNQEKGLQIPIDMMAQLACARRATMYNGSLLLKGLCSMFVPVLQNGSSIVWHYLMNENYAWMSHEQAQESCARITSIDFTALASSTHYVGWTRNAELLAGE